MSRQEQNGIKVKAVAMINFRFDEPEPCCVLCCYQLRPIGSNVCWNWALNSLSQKGDDKVV